MWGLGAGGTVAAVCFCIIMLKICSSAPSSSLQAKSVSCWGSRHRTGTDLSPFPTGLSWVCSWKERALLDANQTDSNLNRSRCTSLFNDHCIEATFCRQPGFLTYIEEIFVQKTSILPNSTVSDWLRCVCV